MPPFTVDDLRTLSDAAVRMWTDAADEDWDVRAGSLEWSCREAAAHVVDTMFAPAFFLASRRTHDYPNFAPLRPEPEIAVAELVDGLIATTNLLVAIIETSPTDVRAIIRRSPAPVTAPPADFAPRGALELAVHCHDIGEGLGRPWVVEPALAARLRDHTVDWPLPNPPDDGGSGADPWADLLQRFGR